MMEEERDEIEKKGPKALPWLTCNKLWMVYIDGKCVRKERREGKEKADGGGERFEVADAIEFCSEG